MKCAGIAPDPKEKADRRDSDCRCSAWKDTVSTVSHIFETNELVFAGSVARAERLRVKLVESKQKARVPWWKRRLEGQIKQLRKDLTKN